MRGKIKLRERLRYAFDSIMSKGMIAKILMLLALMVVFVFAVGVVSALIREDIRGLLPSSIWKTLTHTLDPGVIDGSEGSFFYIALMLLATLFGVFFTAVLIGLINDGITKKMDDLSKGIGRVLSKGHIVILGFNETVFDILEEIIEARRNRRRKMTIVIMDNIEVQEMYDIISEKLQGNIFRKKIRIICKNGTIFDRRSLMACGIENSRSVIINVTDDFKTIKAILACTSLMNTIPEKCDSFSVAVIRSKENELIAKLAGDDDKVNDRLELLMLQDLIAKVIVNASRQPGIAKVFTEILSFFGKEFHILKEDTYLPQLYGKSVRQINRQLKNHIAVGIYNEKAGVIIGNPNDAIFREGDFLITLADDDSPMELLAAPVEVENVCSEIEEVAEKMNILILRREKQINSILCEQAEYICSGSSILIAGGCEGPCTDIAEAVLEKLKQRGIKLVCKDDYDIYDNTLLEKLIDEFMPDSIIVLSDNNALDEDAEDEKNLKLLIYLRENRLKTGTGYGITCEIQEKRNRDLAAGICDDNFIISRHMSALLMTQIALDREKRPLFRELLSSYGREIYTKNVEYYIEPERETDLFSIMDAVAQKGDVFLGVGTTESGTVRPVLAPDKFEGKENLKKYSFRPGDKLIVLADE
ncbi:MAG: CASTOR/POLLUX-related putative ion channel [Lachnospiraceae bacterium]|jgi:hypothetical protein